MFNLNNDKNTEHFDGLEPTTYNLEGYCSNH